MRSERRSPTRRVVKSFAYHPVTWNRAALNLSNPAHRAGLETGIGNFPGTEIWGLRIERGPDAWAIGLGIFISLAWLFLFIISPFFLKSLHWVALVGWIIAFGLLLFAALTQAL